MPYPGKGLSEWEPLCAETQRPPGREALWGRHLLPLAQGTAFVSEKAALRLGAVPGAAGLAGDWEWEPGQGQCLQGLVGGLGMDSGTEWMSF